MYSIIMVTYNSEKYIWQCIESMQKHTPKEECEIIIVDNSGKNYGIEGVIVNKSGSYPSGLNQGIAAAKYDTLICCNPDIIVGEGWLNNVDNFLNQYGIISFIDSNESTYTSGVQGVRRLIFNQIFSIDVSWYIAFCFAIRRDVYNRIGDFDERFLHECDDLDYSYRARKKGVKIGIIPGNVLHIGMASSKTTKDESYMNILKSTYNFFSKYPEVNFAKEFGYYYDISRLNMLKKTFPDIDDIESFRIQYKIAKGSVCTAL